MTLAEFNAWFAGFSEHLSAPSGELQWERLKIRVQEINGVPVTSDFVDRIFASSHSSAVHRSDETGAVQEISEHFAREIPALGQLSTDHPDQKMTWYALYVLGRAEAALNSVAPLVD